MPPKSRRNEPRGKKKKRKPERPAWLIPAIGGGGLALCLVIALIVWLSSGRGGGGGGGGAGGGGGNVGANAAEAGDPGRGIASAREPQAGPNSWIATAIPESATPDKWKVQADPPAARAAELKSFLPMPAEKKFNAFGYALQSNCTQMAVFSLGGELNALAYEWIRYDLTKSEPIGRVKLYTNANAPDRLIPQYKDDTKALLAALSPSGQRVVLGDHLDLKDGKPFEVWGADGQRVARFNVPSVTRDSVEWVAFGGEDRIWTATPRLLTQWDIATGKPTVEFKDYTGGHPGVSPGGKYLAVYLAGRVAILNAADGTEVGTLPFKDKPGKGGLAFDPTGKFLAAVLQTKRYHSALAVYDVATGKRTSAINLHSTYAQLDAGIAWVGNRQVAVFFEGIQNAELVDLDLNAQVMRFGINSGKYHLLGHPAPDGRHWQMRKFHATELTKLDGKLPKVDDAPQPWCIAASSIPKEYFETLDKARNGGVLWHPGVTVQLAVFGNPIEKDKTLRGNVAEDCADICADRGYRIDPKAELTLEMNINIFTNGDLGCRSQVKKNGKLAFGAEGHTIMNATTMPTTGRKYRSGFSAAPYDLPKLYFCDSELRRLNLPTDFTNGVDGLLDPILTIPK
jgi:hypothetical protein